MLMVMLRKHLASLMFFAVSVLFALVGAISFASSTETGSGLRGSDYLNPFFLLFIPRIIPFAGAVVALVFAVGYALVEMKYRRGANFAIAIVQVVAFVGSVRAHLSMVNFWWHVGVSGSEPIQVPVDGMVFAGGLIVSLVCFGINIYWTSSNPPLLTPAATE